MIVNLFHPVKLSRSRSILKKIARPKFFALQSNYFLVQLYLIEQHLFDGVRAVTRSRILNAEGARPQALVPTDSDFKSESQAALHSADLKRGMHGQASG